MFEHIYARVAGLSPEEMAALGTIAIVALASVLVLTGRTPRGGDGPSLAAMTRRPRMIGTVATVIFFAVFGVWSSAAPLSSAAVAPGVVSPDGYRKTIQHLEGGIIRAIHVQEGEAVSAGTLLVSLDDTIARSRRDEVRERVIHLMAAEARLEAEQTRASTITFPDELLTSPDENAKRAIASQTELLRSRQAAQSGREKILDQRVLQLGEQSQGLREMIAAEDRQLELLRLEIDGAEKLYKNGLERQSRLLALQRGEAEVQASQAEHRAQIAQNDQQVGETRIQLLTLREQDAERANTELVDVRRALAELRSQLPARESELARTEIRAPIAGRVMNLHVTTESGVIRAGDPILDIVPDNARLIIDAHVRPIDIDSVHPGMKARVLLTAYRQRSLPQIHGVLRSISADSLHDDRAGHTYFLAQVEVDPDELARLTNVHLVPGMPAEIMILNGERTMLDLLMHPIVESVTKSFREN